MNKFLILRISDNPFLTLVYTQALRRINFVKDNSVFKNGNNS